MELTKTFSDAQFRTALEPWTWLGLDGKKPAFASLVGDVFLEASDGWWFLDTVAGTLTREWSTEAEVLAVLATPEGEERYLRRALVAAAAGAGLALGANDVYGFSLPPILGGAVDLGNVVVVDFAVAQTLAGRLREQAKDLSPAMRAGFRMDEDVAPAPSSRRWFRR